ncbi:hypothetical protein V6N13_048953 [Hibiscus sabdariffa]
MLAAKAFGERSYPCYVSCFVIEVPPSFFLAPETSVGASLSLHCVKVSIAECVGKPLSSGASHACTNNVVRKLMKISTIARANVVREQQKIDNGMIVVNAA